MLRSPAEKQAVPVLATRGAQATALLLHVAAVGALLLASDRGASLRDGGAPLLAIGLLGMWRLSWFLLNATRAALHVHWRFPALRRAAEVLGAAGRPPAVLVLVTSYRIATEVTDQVFTALFAEAAAYGVPTTVVASIAGDGAEEVARAALRRAGSPAGVELVVLAQRENGKRQAMAEALEQMRASGAAASDAVVAFMDGDTLIAPGTFERCFSFFRLRPDLGALTTDERAMTAGSSLAREWFDLRFAQRHLYMAAVGLSDRVLTLTGRFCAFRASIALAPEFIEIVRDDSIEHWRLGHIRFLTGDDKSTWFSVLRGGWSMFYVPDVRVHTFEALPGDGFLTSSVRLMVRWYGNMLRTNGRAVALGPRRVGWFPWWSLLEQRISMWTALVGPTFALVMAAGRRPALTAAYLLWVIAVKTVQSLMVGLPRRRLSALFPFLLYYGQVVGALVKIHVSFRLDEQRWTRQGTGQPARAPAVRRWSSSALNLAAYALFVGLVGGLVPPIPTGAGALTQAELERRLAKAAPGAVVKVAAGTLHLTRPLVIGRDDVVLAGAGRGQTILEGDFAAASATPSALLSVRGELPGAVPAGERRRLAEPAAIGATTLRLDRPLNVARGDLLVLRAANDRAFLDRLGAEVWDRPTPILRQTLARVVALPDGDGRLVELERPLGDALPAGTEVAPVRLRQRVTIRDLTLRYDLGGSPSPSLYLDTRPGNAVDGLSIVAAADVTVENVEVLGAGRHPLDLDTVYQPRVTNVRLEGSWNKGPGGNGYLRVARTSFGTFRGVTLRGLRHLAFQWSSHDNTLTGLDADCDVNFHGGFSRRNRVEAQHLAPRPGHPWGAVTRTGRDASWAPPDGPGNVVVDNHRAVVAVEAR